MLGDLRKRLDAVGRLDVLDSVGAETMRYNGKQPLGSLNADELARRARALQMVGELRSTRGEFGTAAAAFQEAAKTTGELMARDPGNGQRVFDHAQSVFWIGDAAGKSGDRVTKRRAFNEYAKLADRLASIDPDKREWQAEVAYSRQDRGAMEFEDREIGPALADLRLASGIFARVTRADPKNRDLAQAYAQNHAWLADALRMSGSIAEARRARASESAIYRALIARDAKDVSSLRLLAWSKHSEGDLALDAGDTPAAIAHLQEAAAMMRRLHAVEADNVDVNERAVPIYFNLARAFAAAGDRKAALRSVAQARGMADQLVAQDPQVLKWRKLQAMADLVYAEILVLEGNASAAFELAQVADRAFVPATTNKPEMDDIEWRARASRVEAEAGLGTANASWQHVIDLVQTEQPTLRMDEMCTLAVAYDHIGRANQARVLLDRLNKIGYRRAPCETPKSTGRFAAEQAGGTHGNRT